MKKAVWYLKWIILFLVLIGADQMTKQLAVGTLKGNTGFPIIKNVFKLFYLENHGAAFGLFQNQRFPLLIVTIIVLLAIGFVFNRIPHEKKFTSMRWILVVLAAGAVEIGRAHV